MVEAQVSMCCCGWLAWCWDLGNVYMFVYVFLLVSFWLAWSFPWSCFWMSWWKIKDIAVTRYELEICISRCRWSISRTSAKKWLQLLEWLLVMGVSWFLPGWWVLVWIDHGEAAARVAGQLVFALLVLLGVCRSLGMAFYVTPLSLTKLRTIGLTHRLWWWMMLNDGLNHCQPWLSHPLSFTTVHLNAIVKPYSPTRTYQPVWIIIGHNFPIVVGDCFLWLRMSSHIRRWLISLWTVAGELWIVNYWLVLVSIGIVFIPLWFSHLCPTQRLRCPGNKTTSH